MLSNVEEFPKRRVAYVIVRHVGGGGSRYMDLETAVAEYAGAEVDVVVEWLELLRDVVLEVCDDNK